MKAETVFRTVHSLLWERKPRSVVTSYCGQERRQFARSHPLYFLPMHTKTDWTLLGYVYDLSPAGCMVASPRMMKEGETYQVALKMPKAMGRTDGLPVTARCVWMRYNAATDQQLAGCAFEQMGDEHATAVQAVIRDYCYHEEGANKSKK